MLRIYTVKLSLSLSLSLSPPFTHILTYLCYILFSNPFISLTHYATLTADGHVTEVVVSLSQTATVSLVEFPLLLCPVRLVSERDEHTPSNGLSNEIVKLISLSLSLSFSHTLSLSLTYPPCFNLTSSLLKISTCRCKSSFWK